MVKRVSVRAPLQLGAWPRWAHPAGYARCLAVHTECAGLSHWYTIMQSKAVLEFSDVQRMASAALAYAQDKHWAVCIAIVDDGGHLLHLQRLDGTAAISAHIAMAKANTAALGRRESKIFEDVVNGGRTAFLSAPMVQGLLEGGVPIMVNGQCIGAVGVSGVKSSEDAEVAKAGIAALAV